MSTPSRWTRFVDGVDRRIGHIAILRAAADEPLRGGARMAYVFGSALLFTFAIQVVTGIAMATVYSPSTTQAWGSVYYIQEQMTLGWMVRGLHHFGASAMIVLCVLHMTQVLLFGAHRPPREANWTTGVLMLLLVLAFALTGYLLPWDQKGYWATRVVTSIVGSAPGGGVLKRLLLGGTQAGNLTLSHLYIVHIIVLPVALTFVIISHVSLFRRHGLTPNPRRPAAELDRRVETFWPYQVLRDVLIACVVLGILVALTVFIGAELHAPAAPASAYEARPAWYFLFLFQLVKSFEGPMVFVGTLIIPALAVGFLLLVPFLDRRDGDAPRGPGKRVLVPFLAIFVGVGTLTAISVHTDAHDAGYQKAKKRAAQNATRAIQLAKLGGIDPAGHVILYAGEKLFHDKACASCHSIKTLKGKVKGGKPAPLLGGYGTRARLTRFMRWPDAPDFYGKTLLATGMDKWQDTSQRLDDMVTWMLSLSGRHHDLDAKAIARGAKLFISMSCTDCHNDPKFQPGDKDYDPTQLGNDMRGYERFEYVRGLIRDASDPRYYGGGITKSDRKNAMPAYPDLSDKDLNLLTRYLLAGAPGADTKWALPAAPAKH